MRWIERRPPTEFLLTAAHIEFPAGFALGLALFTTVMLVLWILRAYQPSGYGSVAPLAAGFLDALLAAILEEILFRGFLFRLTEKLIGLWGALLFTSALFGAAHAFNPGATLGSSIAIALEAGLLLGAAYAWKHRLWLPIGLHLGWNFAEGSIFGMSVSGGTVKGSLILGTLHGRHPPYRRRLRPRELHRRSRRLSRARLVPDRKNHNRLSSGLNLRTAQALNSRVAGSHLSHRCAASKICGLSLFSPYAPLTLPLSPLGYSLPTARDVPCPPLRAASHNQRRWRIAAMFKRSVKAGLLALLVISISATLEAQSTFGGIVGVVKDQSGLLVPGAQLTLSGLDDQSSHTAVSDPDGSFQFMNVKAGRYDISVQAPGFAPFKLQSVRLEARQTLREEITLKVASASEVVEVGDRAPMINTESATLSDTKDFLQASQLPVNYRGATTSSMAMLATVPGTQQDANGNVSVGGGLPSQVQYSVDGASTVNIRQNGALGNMNPSSELIGEFKVSQFNNNAEFSQLGDITITTKSGTEHFHGSAFEYLQNSVLDATTFGFTDKPHKAFNTYGGSLGGPLRIPGSTRALPGTFFFADYEANRRRLITPLFLNVPTAGMRAWQSRRT